MANQEIVYVDREIEKVVYKDRIVYQDKIIEKEVCSVDTKPVTETPPVTGTTSFDVYSSGVYDIGEMYSTKTDDSIVVVTGINGGAVGSDYPDYIMTFKTTPKSFPEPEDGIKGDYYFMYGGDVVYVDIMH